MSCKFAEFTYSGFFFVESLGFSTYKTMSPVRKNNFNFSFSICIPLIYLFIYFCIIPLARIFSNLLYRRDESRHSCIVLNLNGKEDFSLSQITMVFAVDFSYMDFII